MRPVLAAAATLLATALALASAAPVVSTAQTLAGGPQPRLAPVAAALSSSTKQGIHRCRLRETATDSCPSISAIDHASLRVRRGRPPDDRPPPKTSA